MPSRIDDLFDCIADLERELETELNRVRVQWRYRVEAGRIRFEREVRLAHRRLKQSIPQFLRESSPAALLSAPLIYSMIVPIVLLDGWITVYQAICFRIYGVELVRRSTYIVIDRHHLGYLNAIEKVNCVYCGMRPVCLRTSGRLPDEPNNTGVRFATPSGPSHRIHIIVASSTTATLMDIAGG